MSLALDVTRRPLLQELLLARDPSGWRLLCGCVLLNVTTREAADRVWPELFRRWPDPGAMASAHWTQLRSLLRPLGCSHRRANTLRWMSRDFVARPPRTADNVRGLYGLGRYAADSWAIFVEGRRDLEPTDRVLAAWLEAGSGRSAS